MTRFLLKRIGFAIFVIWALSTTVFFVTHIVTDPAKVFLPPDATNEQLIQTRHLLHLDDPLYVQYWTFLKGLVHLDLGQSFWQKTDALGLVMDKLPATAELVAAGMLVVLVIAFPAGIIASLRPGSRLDKFISTASLTGLSIPQFWLAFILILVFGVKLGWLPTSGNRTTSAIVLPAIALGAPSAGRVAQLIRSSMIDQIDQPYMTAAEAKGMSMAYRVTRHAIRNASIPILTMISWEFLAMFAGATIVVETVLSWPGVGYLMTQSLDREDLMVVQAVVLVSSIVIVLINLFTDLLYVALDPRIKVA